ncbi:MAG TPA: hypothetical protein VFR37_14355 [Longimicrobium sp.]|nr:hypothetical protein [Longimicrobium sp.]
MHASVTLLLHHRAALRRLMVLFAVAVPLLFVARAAVVVEDWPARRFALLYIAPFFVAFFVWARLWLDRVDRDPPRALAVDAAAAVLGAVRMAAVPLVPFSGHMVFFAYSALTTRSARYLLLVLALAAGATWFKLVLWRDPASWALGMGLGTALAAVRIFLQRHSPVPTTTTP